jgi:hypothetical protein
MFVAIGGLCLVSALVAIVSGRTTQSTRHRWGFPVTHEIGRDRNPIQFWFLTLLQIAIGCGLLLLGVTKLLH